MTGPIRGTGSPSVRAPGSSGKKGSERTRSAGGGGATREDSVTIGSTAGQLDGISRAMATIPVVDAEKVEGIREQLAHGLYEIDSYQVATKLIEVEMMLHEVSKGEHAR